MHNRDIYQKDPSTRKLVNEGVASVNDEMTSQARSVLRYELETFVCDGQYERGLEHVLDVFLKNIEQAEQPAVWVSGFYGSGKSHLVKMLRALWVDTPFEDGATARGIASLPASVTDQLRELSIQAKRHGGLHAASGTLGSSSQDKTVRLALLSILFKSVGLPESYPVARFVLWLRNEGIEDSVRREVERSGLDWAEELDNFYVAAGLHEALVRVRPNLFSSQTTCVETLNNLYPYVKDVSSGEMLKAIRQALVRDGKFPLTLIVLDEVQQYIGEDSQRSIDVQEVVEACSKSFGGKMLFIGTGQTAVTGTSNLKKLEGRFTVRVELSDADVDAVIRKVILAKKPEARPAIEAVLQTNLGEISRHLAGTTIGHRGDDIPHFPQDYPILPVRRRLWEKTLRVLDKTGTDSQLRNQLSLIHRVIQDNLDAPLGSVARADYLYFDAADKLLQSRTLPRNLHEKTMLWAKGSADERLMARCCGLVFLLNKLASSNHEIGLRATVDTLADLLVEDLTEGSSALRGKLPQLLDGCDLLMKVGDEYRIQTAESSAWNDDFLSHCNSLANETHRLDVERDDRLRRKFGELVNKLSLTQGVAKVPRTIELVFDSRLPGDAGEKVCVWVRDGWSADESSVRADARQAGNQSPTVFVFIPKRSADDLRRQLISYKAAMATLDKRGHPNTPEGVEAHAAMETTRKTADGKIRELIQDAFSGVRVFQAGGQEIQAADLQEAIREAASNSLQRLYPQFHIADHTGWARVYEKAQRGAPEALKSVGDEGVPANNPVCKAILAFIAGGKKGFDIRKHFEGATYGWPQDAVDGGLQALLVAGLIRALDEKGQTIVAQELERKLIGKTLFKVESATVSTLQRLEIRKLYQRFDLRVTPGEEQSVAPPFLEKAQALAQRAGGPPPRPPRPVAAMLDEIRRTAGNEQLLALYNQRDELHAAIDAWTHLAERIEARLPGWQILERLRAQAAGLPGAEVLAAQVDHIEQQRQLLEDPDPIAPLAARLTQLLREELNRLHREYLTSHAHGLARLAADSNWSRLEPEQRETFLADRRLGDADTPLVQLANTEEVLETIDRLPLRAFADRVAALDSRFEAVQVAAAQTMEPEAQLVKLPHSTIKTEDDLESWLQDARRLIALALKKGPVLFR